MIDNTYSDTWFSIFLETIPEEQTSKEILFLENFLPKTSFKTILDICCGSGRHSIPLAKQGYEVWAVDINDKALEKAENFARESSLNINFLKNDMRELNSLEKEFDGIILLWQSFGHFSEEVNEKIIKQISNLLNNNGRFVLDLYNRAFFEKHQGTREVSRGGDQITEVKKMEGNRLYVKLEYMKKKTIDMFSWQLYGENEIERITKKYDLDLVLACSNFETNQPPNENIPRIQYIFQKNM